MELAGQKITNINIIETELLTPEGDSLRAANAVCALVESNLDAQVGRVDSKSVALNDAEMTVILDVLNQAITRHEANRDRLVEKAAAAGLIESEA